MAAGTKVSHYTNREISWVAFNRRVLMEASNEDNPIFERLKFMSIVSTNLDEFFMIRVASLRDQIQAGYKGMDPSGLKPSEQLHALSAEIRRLVNRQYKIYNEKLMPELDKEKVRVVSPEFMTRDQLIWLENYFDNEVFPVLTPMAVDITHHFPLILSRTLNIAVMFAPAKKEKKGSFATVQVPNILPRAVVLPAPMWEKPILLLETVIMMYVNKLFPGRQVAAVCPYRITRNADLTFDEDEASDLLNEIQKSLKKRKWGSVIRLEVQKDTNETIMAFLKQAFEVSDGEVYRVNGPINLDFLMKQIYGFEGFERVKYAPFRPEQFPALTDGDIFEAIKQHDWFLHHPYDSFEPVLHLIRQAATDENVLAIKQTLYRVSGNSPVIAALIKAAENGKQVTVLVELKARFDEENNIHWCKELEKAGCHVIYGVKGLKTHSKITLIVRRENDTTVRYTHLGTGNYNDVTARLYTDMGILTANALLGRDAADFFNMLTGNSSTPPLKLMSAAPKQLRPELLGLIAREKEHAQKGEEALIRAKMNALVDSEIIQALYDASCAGVRIELMIRGICCLQPGIKDVSENIEVRSIVGRFLEHARIFYFKNGNTPETYLSSADWMPRNLDRRVELMFPVLDSGIAKRVLDVLDMQWKDTLKAWVLKSDGVYERRSRQVQESPLNAQEEEIKLRL